MFFLFFLLFCRPRRSVDRLGIRPRAPTSDASRGSANGSLGGSILRFERSSAGCDAARSHEPALSTRGKTHRVLRARPRVDATPRRVRGRRGVTIPNRVARRKGPLASPLSPSWRVSATRFAPSRGGRLLFFRDTAFTVRNSSIPRPAASRLMKMRLLRRFVYLLLPGVGRRRRIARVVASSDARALDVAPAILGDKVHADRGTLEEAVPSRVRPMEDAAMKTMKRRSTHRSRGVPELRSRT